LWAEENYLKAAVRNLKKKETVQDISREKGGGAGVALKSPPSLKKVTRKAGKSTFLAFN